MTNARSYEAPPVRDRLPTIPHDLSEYARTQTGPSPEAHSAVEHADGITHRQLAKVCDLCALLPG